MYYICIYLELFGSSWLSARSLFWIQRFCYWTAIPLSEPGLLKTKKEQPALDLALRQAFMVQYLLCYCNTSILIAPRTASRLPSGGFLLLIPLSHANLDKVKPSGFRSTCLYNYGPNNTALYYILGLPLRYDCTGNYLAAFQQTPSNNKCSVAKKKQLFRES